MKPEKKQKELRLTKAYSLEPSGLEWTAVEYTIDLDSGMVLDRREGAKHPRRFAESDFHVLLGRYLLELDRLPAMKEGT